MPTDLKSQCLLAAALMQKGRETGDIGAYQEARRATEAALKSAPDSLDAQVTAAWSATVFHDFDTAVRLAERALESDPGAASAYGIVCDSRLELGDYDAAADAAQAMMDRKPNLASYSRAAHVRWFFGDVKGAILLMKKAAEAGGGREAVAWCRVQLADMMAKSGAYPAAEAEYERALAGLPGYRHALAGLARARFASGHAEEAVRLMRKATEVGPTVSNLDDLGDMLAAAGRKDEAEEAHRRAAGLMGSHLAAGIGGDEPAVARLWLSRGEREQEALRLMEAEVEHHKSVAVYATLAWAQAVAGQKDQARASVVQALRTGVREPWVLRRCGEVLEACGDPEGGGRLLAEARAVCPSEQAWRLL
jgi:tetratricopeptide (TPR) repeat protein